MTISNKKQFSCRISNEAYDFLRSLSIELGTHHPVSKDLPNISKTLDIVITGMINLKVEKKETFNELIEIIK